LLTLICWIAIYPVDSVIQPLNNWGQVSKKTEAQMHTHKKGKTRKEKTLFLCFEEILK